MPRQANVSHKVTSGEAVCPYCGVGCRLWAESAYNEILRVKGVADAPANFGGICAKGATLGDTVTTKDRLHHPLVRTSRAGEFRPVTWDQALNEMADRFQSILAKHGPNSVAFYGSGQLDSLAIYCAVKLFKGNLRTNNTDSNSRLCMATAAAAYKTSLGSDGPPTCYDDIDLADVIVIVGANMAEAHPVTFDRIKAAKRARPDLRVVVIDPRRTQTADHADMHLAVAPGRDISLLNALGKALFELGACGTTFVKDSTADFDGYRQTLVSLDLKSACETAGVAIDDVLCLAGWIARKKFLSFYCMGVGQSTFGMWKINSLLNLHLLTGSIGKPGCGPFSLTGQPNAMGGREVGLLTGSLPGYRSVESPDDRRQVENYWGIPAGSIQNEPGLTAVEMFRSLERGTLKAIWIAATNPLVSMPDLHHVRRAHGKAELVVVQDSYHPTETTGAADIILPAASWAERTGFSTNSERMVAFSEKIVEPPGSALPDWQILCRFAQKMEFPGFQFKTEADVWNEWIGLTKDRLCDMTGMPFDRLMQMRSLQWPCPAEDHPGTKRLYVEGRFQTPNGKAKFLPRSDSLPKESTDHEFPLVLTTGRVYGHWHTMTRTGKARKLMLRSPKPFVEISPILASAHNLSDGDVVQISSRRGTIRLPARITDRVPANLLFLPIHWGDLYSEDNGINYLTLSAIGRVAKQPELKHCAVAIEKVPSRPAPIDEAPGKGAAEAPSSNRVHKELSHVNA